MFYRAIESRPWSAQRTWAVRVLKGEGFSIVAPTGVGKTVFGMIMALFISDKLKKGKSYIIVPTTTLVKQVSDRLEYIIAKIRMKMRVVSYYSHIEKKIEKIRSGDFDIIITTSQFISRRFEILQGKTFKFIIVDDVDAILKSSRNIDKVLKLLGFSDEIIKTSMEIIKMKTILLKLRNDSERNELVKKIYKYEKTLKKNLRKGRGILIVSTATGRPRGVRIKLFRELSGYEEEY